MKPIRPAAAVPVYAQVAAELRNQIMVGELRPGDRLPAETVLSEQFGVARTSVREALRVLASQGLVRTLRGSRGGTVVQQVGHRDVRRILEESMQSLVVSHGCSHEEMEEVRELLEVTSTWLAATRRTPQHLERLAACIQPVRRGTKPTRDQVDTNLRFHYEILEATGNRLLHLFAEPVSVVIYSFFRTQEHRPAYYQRVTSDHQAVLEAIRARDPDRARAAMAEHIHNLRYSEGTQPSRSTFAGLRFDSPSEPPAGG